jgi:hypothetical protein
MKLESLKPGDVVYSISRGKMGNTTMRTTSVHHVTIKSIDLEKQTCVASWNCNKDQTFYRHTWSKWRKNEPVMIRSAMGSSRVATRAEIAAIKSQAK